ncbi:GNAT family N-acetyltransferase [Paenibacillus sp. 1001270B_150601_E10]|uniref:GNAT family N-acetyltransferase n=1 Tax=Paenibacillus sp. 1001270B_150601_E10 TaxID=2787079 RepID=UPI00189E66D9|nr:GNAT family N-acetyltransferase [Paenibacillus sp. 1001270B_150601_E10]
MGNPIMIRRAATEDAAELARLNEEFNGVQLTKAEVIEGLSQSQEIVLIAFYMGRAVGFICGQHYRSFCYLKRQAEITEMYVMEEARRQGIATLLIKQLEEELMRHDVDAIKVLTGEHNQAGRKTYEHSQYEWQDEIVLEKTFSQ